MTDDQTSVTQHYGRPNLTATILDALSRAGVDVENLSVDHLAPVEEFHIGGREATHALARLAGVGQAMHVLDVGCGIGGPARALATAYGCRVTGIDLTEQFCHAALDLTQRTRLSELVEIRQADALKLPFEDGSFDLVWMQHVSMNIADKARLYAEARRVLTGGGILALYEILAGPVSDLHFPVPWARHAEISFLASPDELRQRLAALEFRETAWHDVTDEATAWFRQIRQKFASEGPPPLGLATLMGTDFPTMAGNVLQNLEEDRLRVVRAVYTAPG